MLNELLQLLPAEPGGPVLLTLMVGTVVGAALWLLGVKVSRPLITLLTVLFGATLGMRLPQWSGWQISGAGPAVGGAVVLGVSGFVLHRMWVGVGLGSVLAVWAGLATWLAMRDPSQPWVWPQLQEGQTCCAYLKDVWANVPPSMARVMPFACGTALVSGVAACILWPRLTTVLHWSMTGVTMLVGLGIAALAYGRHESLGRLPSQTWVQMLILLGMVALGAMVQWKLAPGAAKRSGKHSQTSDPKGEPTN